LGSGSGSSAGAGSGAGARRRAGKKTAKKRTARKHIRRTVMYSRGGKKLYAVRGPDGEFRDIQRYSRAHAQDIKRRAADEQ
jgi:hypothetical protein